MQNIEKLIQACNYLIKKNDNSLNYTKLIKMLYLADKEALKGSLQTISSDVYVSMDNGPVLSRLYDLVRGCHGNKDFQNIWNSRFICDGYNLVAATDRIPQGELSKFEINILDQIDSQYKNFSVWDMIDHTHKNCPEWKNPEGSAVPIHPEELLESIGKTPEEIEWILAETKAFEKEDAALLSLAEV